MSIVPISNARSNSPIRSRDSTTPSSTFNLDHLQALALHHPYSSAFLLGSTLTLTFCSSVLLTKRLFFPSHQAAAQITRHELANLHSRVLERLETLETRLGMQVRMMQPDKRAQQDILARLKSIEVKLGDQFGAGGSRFPGSASLSKTGPGSTLIAGSAGGPRTEAQQKDHGLQVTEEIYFSRPSETEAVDLATEGQENGSHDWRLGIVDLDEDTKVLSAAKISPSRAASESSSTHGSNTIKVVPPPSTAPSPPYAAYKRPAAMLFGGLRMGIGKHGPMPIVDPSNPNYM
ncbi:hypothetical protein BD324DRAFT_634572 [Kockovaella imperatae]|uniref:Uncharacterized protein n=1 Tax=Kockovaella imperatae TaxID=4999 RepID=A0A1Y1UB35_9TREE|nr:hypothetical protein BD324DRAFT_634572 [Kockovaella imperatae]ORX34706.1 hypothetical protein BD324DRAFT_634572 [Kockovaella imperatae]